MKNYPPQSCELSWQVLMHNLVQWVSDRDDSVILQHLVTVIKDTKDTPSEITLLAKKKAEKKAILQRAQHTQTMMGTIKGNETLHEVFNILQQGNHTRLDVLDEEIAVMEKKYKC